MLRLLWLFVLAGWFAYIGHLIIISDIHILFKVILTIGDIVIGYYCCMACLHDSE
jgi:hypothetical protein